jgi:hypothetical protein
MQKERFEVTDYRLSSKLSALSFELSFNNQITNDLMIVFCLEL